MVILCYHGHSQVPGSVEMIPISFPELPIPSRTPGKAKNLNFRSRNFTENIEKHIIIIFLINPFLGGPPRGDGPDLPACRTPGASRLVPRSDPHTGGPVHLRVASQVLYGSEKGKQVSCDPELVVSPRDSH